MLAILLLKLSSIRLLIIYTIILVCCIILYFFTKKEGYKNNKVSKSQVIFVGIFFMVSISIYVLGFMYRDNKIKEIHDHAAFSVAKITKYLPAGAKGSDFFSYECAIKNRSYGGDHIGIWPNAGSIRFINQYFPLIYDSLQPDKQQLLITPEDFKKFDIPFPDSLKWVIPYYNKNF